MTPWWKKRRPVHDDRDAALKAKIEAEMQHKQTQELIRATHTANQKVGSLNRANHYSQYLERAFTGG